eukprot:COSAG04_NODE_19476_length_415_cov_1.303797_2_plen_61_part_01
MVILSRFVVLPVSLTQKYHYCREKFEGNCWDQCYVHPVPGKCVPACDVERYMLGTAQALKA